MPMGSDEEVATLLVQMATALQVCGRMAQGHGCIGDEAALEWCACDVCR